MSLHRGIDGAGEPANDPVGRAGGAYEHRPSSRSSRLATGTLACPRCDAPVSLGGRSVSPAATLVCPYCDLHGVVRDFLSLALPTRPARVTVRVVARRRSGRLRA